MLCEGRANAPECARNHPCCPDIHHAALPMVMSKTMSLERLDEFLDFRRSPVFDFNRDKCPRSSAPGEDQTNQILKRISLLRPRLCRQPRYEVMTPCTEREQSSVCRTV